jgi:solute:Na+ symporter, SSS family
LPAVLIGLYTRWFNDWALLIGWLVGTVVGTWMAAVMNFTATYPLALAGWIFPGYAALYSVILNLVVAVVLTPVFNLIASKASDQTVAADYHA